MRPALRLLAAALVMAVLPLGQPAAAQEKATLVADRIFLTGNDLLTAEGAVEAYYKGARVTARRIVYDATTDRMTILGPISLTDESGTVILAESAELSRDLQNGILQSARMVLDRQLQMAAVELQRIDGRYTQLDKVVASSCQVCASNPRPLWEIRARRVTHDKVEQQIYFDQAQFRVAGVPVFYLPRLRMPDPTLDRATGFLVPELRTNSEIGPGLKIPYFIVIDDSRDLTLTPYLAATRTTTLGFRYREALRNGSYSFTGALTDDDIRPGTTRGYFFGETTLSLPREFTLSAQFQKVSDRAYLLDYDITDTDWLASGVTVERARRNEYVGLRFYQYESLRAGDTNSTLPNLTADFDFQRRFSPRYIGGEGRIAFQMQGHRRSSSVNFDANGDGVVDGRDVSRASMELGWHRNWVLANGMIVGGATEIAADVYSISEDAAFPGSVARVLPQAAVELRWPWMRAGAGGASQVIEPIVQFIAAPNSLDAVPNEDSTIAAFDEGNLFSFSRFPGTDARELGSRMNVGLNWTRYDPSGWSVGVTGGRVFRTRDLGQFSPGSGLDGATSDWLVSAQLRSASGFALSNRVLFDDDFDFSRNELNLAYANDRYSVNAGYLWMVADPLEGRNAPTSELVFDAGWNVSQNWRGLVSGRYDFNDNQAARAEVGLSYQNECAIVDLSLSRRFTSSTTVQPSTSFNLSVSLVGFGSGPDGRSSRRSCAR